MSWRNAALGLLLLCGWMQWRACTRYIPPPIDAKACAAIEHETTTRYVETDREPPPTKEIRPGLAIERAADGGLDAYGFHVPGWAVSLAPQEGEDMLAYRDRIVPLAQAAIAPQRSRVARSRDDLAQRIGLDDRQKRELEAATTETASAIEERALRAAFSGELDPATWKPMMALAALTDVLQLVEQGNARFMATLSTEQRAKLALHPFDFGDYLLFATRWEDVLGMPK